MSHTSSIRFGIQQRLFLAIGGILLLTSLGFALTWFAFVKTAKSVETLSQESIPTIIASLKMSNETSQAAALSPLLMSARNTEDLEAFHQRFQNLAVLIQQQIEILTQRGVDAGNMQQINDLKAALVEKESTLNDLTAQRLILNKQYADLLLDIVFGYSDLDETVTPLIEVVDLDVSRGLSRVASDPTKAQKLEADLDFSRQLVEIKANANLIFGLFLAGLNVPEGDAMDEIQSKYSWSELRITRALEALPEGNDRDLLGGYIKALIGYSSLFDLREEEWEITFQQNKILEETKALSSEINALGAELVGVQEQNARKNAQDSVVTINQAQQSLVIIAASVIVVSLLIIFLYIRRNLTSRLLQAIDDMRAISQGNFNTAITVKGNDEISQMNEMLLVFCQTGKEAEVANAKVAQERERAQQERQQKMAALAQEFEASISQQLKDGSQAAVSIHSTSETAAQKARNNASNAASIASATEETTVSMETVASATQALSQNLYDFAEKAQASLNHAETAVGDSNRASAQVETLSQAAQEIGEILSMIGEIADQTNMLALNATIEAARAGDAGKGFAVVASEVKGLADQTSKATQEISMRIRAIQDSTGEAVAAIGNIGERIQDIHHSAGDMSTSVTTQQQFVSEITENVDQVASAMREVSNNISSVRDATQDNTVNMQNIVTASDTLINLSQSIQDAADNFITVIKE